MADKTYDVASETMVFDVDGMTCATCATRIERVLGRQEGVEAAAVNLTAASAIVRTKPGIDVEGLRQAVDKIGYSIRLHPEEEAPRNVVEHYRGEERIQWRRFWIAAVLSLIVMVLAMLGPDTTAGIIAQAALVTPVVFWAGWQFHRVAWKQLLSGGANMDTLISLGSLVAYGYSLWALTAGEEVFFETSGMIITLITLGRALEARAKGRASTALRRLAELAATDARVMVDGREVVIPIEQVVPGDLMVVLPGEKIPTDGIVEAGATTVDESMLTGESMPTDRGPGESVYGATVNQQGRVEIRATAVGADTALAGITRLVEQAQITKAPVQKLADQVSAVFVPIVIVIATLTAIAWLVSGGDVTQALRAGVSVLIIACPCALGLATPTAIMVGSGRGAELGILFKTGDVFERAKSIDVVMFDKTGTLTTGVMTLADVETNLDESHFLTVTGSVEAASGHPIGKAVALGAEDRGITLPIPESVEALPGLGVEGTVNGTRVLVGKAALMRERGIEVSNRWASGMARAEARGQTAFVAALDGEVSGVLAVADVLRADAATAVSRLAHLGVKTEMITGDNKITAAHIAGDLGIESVHAEVLPGDKAEAVRKSQDLGSSVAFVGDGVNDAPALTTADLGMAMGSGTGVAVEAGDVVLMRDDPRLVAAAIELATATFRVIRQNLGWAFGYNVVAIPIAALGLLNPMIAAGAMALSSVSVVANALRLKRFEPFWSDTRVGR